MAFRIRMGVPEMEAFWNDLSTRKQTGELDKTEESFSRSGSKLLVISATIQDTTVWLLMKLTI
jgi:hypothetical protein